MTRYPAGVRAASIALVFFALVAVALLPSAGCRRPRPDLSVAEKALETGAVGQALAEFDRVAAHKLTPPAERARALTGAALACERLGDGAGAESRLGRAIDPDVPGASEPALFYLAERLRTRDPARALNLYYRAAAGAEQHRGGAFPYRAASERILLLSMSR